MPTATLILLLLIAVSTDIRHRRIPNSLILAGLIAGIAFQYALPLDERLTPPDGIGRAPFPALAGIAVGLVCTLPMYLLRAMGAGDVKLLMMIGVFLGPLQTLGVVVLAFVAGGLLALLTALYRRSLANLILNLRFMLTTSAVRAVTGASPRFDPLQQTAGRMPFAVAITVGTLAQLMLIRSGGWVLS